ncbi:MAG: T9SS type A sorting domain-containing protein [Flavobacteriales bacterium]|nr:T9SS type A sorting domain-containing protein [Flavobacteriales bacterium]
MRIFVFTFLIALFIPRLLGQPLSHQWVNRVGGGADNEKLWRIAVDGTGNVYATGYFRGTFTDQGISVTSIGGADIILLKYAPDGTLLWARNAGGTNDDAGFGIDCDKEGNVYVTGLFSGLAIFDTQLLSIPEPDGTPLPFHFVARYDPDGDLVWVRTVTVPMLVATYPNSIGYAVKLDRAGDLIVVGSYTNTNVDAVDPAFSTMQADTCRFLTTYSNGYTNVFAQKLDTLGNTEWVHSVGGLNGFGSLFSLTFDAQNHIWTGGNMYGAGFVSGPVNLPLGPGQGGLVYELSSTGQPLSGFLVPATGFANVEDLIVANNGEVFLAGWYQGGALAGGPPAQGYDGFLMRTSPSGTPVWVNRLTGPGDDFFSGIATTPSPNEIVGGAFYFYQAAFAGTNLSLASGTNSALVRLDTMGTLLEVLQPQLLGGLSKIADVQSDDFGNFFLCGDVSGNVLFTNDTLQCTSQDMYVTKVVRDPSAGADELSTSVDRWSIFPNPADTWVTLRTDGLGWRPERVIVLDLAGRVVQATPLRSDRDVLDVSALSSGAYRLVLEGAEQRTSRTIMVQR